MKLSPDQYDWSKKLKRVKVNDPAAATALAGIAAGEKHVVLRAENGTEVVGMSLEEYESIMETLEILGDEEAVKGIREGLKDLEEGRTHTFEEVFGHPLGESGSEGRP